MVVRRIDEAVEAMSAELIGGDPAAPFRGAALDSRKVHGGELFFALSGEHADGHDFVASALAAGAAGAVVDRQLELDCGGAALLRVEGTFAGLHDLTRYVRRSLPRYLVAVTGSSGKTTTKEILAAMLSTRFRTGSSPGNLNNLYGFPLALLALAEDTEWMVAEMGMSVAGELKQVSELGRPDVVLLTNVGAVHLGSFASVDAIAAAKWEILAGLDTDGIVVVNADDGRLRKLARGESGRGRRVVSFGLGPEQVGERPLRVENLEVAVDGRAGSRFDLVAGKRRAGVRLRLPGRHNVENCLAAATVAVTVGCELEAIAAAASEVAPVAMRGVVEALVSGALLWDDTYNSNPDALQRTLAAAAELSGDRHWAVLGAMLELGPGGAELHRDCGRLAVFLGFDPIIGVGKDAAALVEAAKEAGAAAVWVETAAQAVELARAETRAGDVVLVKGSRGVGLEVVADALRQEG